MLQCIFTMYSTAKVNGEVNVKTGYLDVTLADRYFADK